MDFYKNFIDFKELQKDQAYGLCPFHKEKIPSFTVNTNTEQWFCHGCGEGGGKVTFLMKLLDLSKVDAIDIVNTWEEKHTFPFPSENLVEEAHECLKANTEAKELLYSWGVTDKIIDNLQLGFSNAEQRFYIPVRSPYGYLCNIRKYMPPEYRAKFEKSPPKCMGITGCNQARFYPYENLFKDTIFIVEGEKDCLCAIGQGLNAITGTGGSNVPCVDYSIFKNKKVYVMTDNDEAGDKIAQKYIDIISGQTNDIKRIRLPVKDFTEYYLKYGDGNILQYSELVGYDIKADEVQAKQMTLTENEGVDNIGTRVIFNNMIITGYDPQTYAIPKCVSIKCACVDCKKPCKLFGGKTAIDYEFDDRDLVAMLNKPDSKVTELCHKFCGCKKINISTTAMTNVQRVTFQEKASLLQGLEATSFDPRVGFYLYDKTRLTATAKYTLDATKITGPDNQKAYYVIKNAQLSDREYSAPINRNYFQHIYERSNGVVDFIKKHYDKWLADCGVYGRADLFSAFLLTMCSVTEIPYRNGKIKGLLDTMVIGDTRTGKSQLATRMISRLDMGGYINGENAKLTGVLGGVIKLGDAWIISWGAIPLNDKGALVIDEASGLLPEDISQLSNVRSASRAEITKVVRGEASARTRLFWISNPRNGKNLTDFMHKGFAAFQSFIPVNEDQARYDLLIGASRDDIDTMQKIEQKPLPEEEVMYYRNLISKAWSIEPEKIILEDEDHLIALSKELGKKYRGGTLLIPEATYEKLLRVGCSLAVLTCSFDDEENLIVSNNLLDCAKDYLEWLFTRPAIDYEFYIHKQQEAEKSVEENKDFAKAIINQYPALESLLVDNKFNSTQVQDILGLTKEEAGKLIAQLFKKNMIKMSTSGSYSGTAQLVNIVRKYSRKDTE